MTFKRISTWLQLCVMLGVVLFTPARLLCGPLSSELVSLTQGEKSAKKAFAEAEKLAGAGSPKSLLAAIGKYEEALWLSRSAGDRTFEALSLQNAGSVCFLLGQSRKALEYFNQALAVSRQIANRTYEANALHSLGRVYESFGEKQKALESYNQARSIQRAVAQRGTLHILAIGINQYSNNRVVDLSGAVNDALGLGHAFETLGSSQFERVNLEMLLDAEASRSGIIAALERIVSEVRPQDSFIFIYSGHGLTYKTSSADEEFFLLPSDTDFDFGSQKSRQTGIATSALQSFLIQIQAEHQFIILDAVNSAKGLKSLAERIERDNKSLEGLLRRDIVLLAHDGIAMERADDKGDFHGALTRDILSGLKSGLSMKDGFVTAKRLAQYAATQQTADAKVVVYAAGNDFSLGRPPKSTVGAKVPDGSDLTDLANKYHHRSSGRARSLPGISLADHFGLPWTRSSWVGLWPAVAAQQPEQQPRRRAEIAVAPDRKRTGPFLRKGKDRALLIAIGDYDNKQSWPHLPNPIPDATTIESELKNYYGFETEVITSPHASKKDIINVLVKYVREIKYEEDDQLFVFFAGHGTFSDEFKEGYLIVQNSLPKAEDPTGESFLSHSQLRKILDNIPCKHVFLVIDACFGGTFDERIALRGEANPYAEATNLEFIGRKMAFRTRRFLTSGGKEYVPDGQPGHHSPFARKFIEALRNYGGKEGILTITGILAYIERVSPEPRQGEWGTNEPGSDFVFIAKQARPAAP